MKKHSFTMVFLLILALSLIGAVSASDNVTTSDDAAILEYQGEDQMEVQVDYEISEYVSDEISQSQDEDISVCEDESYSQSIYEESESSDEDYISLEDCESYDEIYLNLDGCDLLSQSVEVRDIHSQPVDVYYELGYDMAKDFGNRVDIGDNADILVITNAGFCRINNQTTNNVLNGIIDASNGYITYEDGNLLSLSSKANSMHVTFIVKNDELLTIASYRNSETPLYYENVSSKNAVSFLEKLGFDKVDSRYYSAVVSFWADGCLDDFNRVTYNVPFGLSGEQDGIQKLNYYPHEFDLPLVDMLGVSRDFDDDAFTLKSANSSDKQASADVSMVGRSMEGLSNYSSDLEQIGVNATNKALDYFKSQGIDFPKDYPYLYVFTSAGYVKLNGLETYDVLKGILKALGPEFDKKHLFSVDDPSWKDLVFYFIVVKNTKCISYAIKYDSSADDFIESSQIDQQGYQIADDYGLFGSSSYDYEPYIPSEESYSTVQEVQKRDLNKTRKAKKVTKHENATGNASSKENKSDDIVQMPDKPKGSPFNIVYNLVAILIVCVMFGVGYRKR